MKKLLLCTIILLTIILLCSSPVFALTINTGNLENLESTNSANNEQNSNGVVSSLTTLELVERNTCEIDLMDPTTNSVVGEFTKELTNYDSSKKEVTLTLTIKNTMIEEQVTKPIEVYLVLDNSTSMERTYNENSKKD